MKIKSTDAAEAREHRLQELSMQARAESFQIHALRVAQREMIREKMAMEEYMHQRLKASIASQRKNRWQTKSSPYQCDLVAENQRILEEMRVRSQLERRNKKLKSSHDQKALQAIFQDAVRGFDQLENLRAESRALQEHDKRLKALRDVEKSNRRSQKIRQIRAKEKMERVQRRLENEAKNAHLQPM
jgi:hypothetical protein